MDKELGPPAQFRRLNLTESDSSDMKLSDELFKSVIAATPLVSIDFVIRNQKGDCLLGLRKNAPAKGFWFNLGGRIFKNETIEQAQARIFLDETGLQLNRESLKFLGVSDHIYDDNLFETPEFGTHYVCLAYEVIVDSDDLPMTTVQHSDYAWRDEEFLLRSEDVHQNTKICFKF